MRNEFQIKFTGLKDGTHEFNYQVKDSFFEHIEYSEVEKGNLDVHVKMDKNPTMMVLDFSIKGQVEVMCDRCTDLFYIDVETEDQIIYKFGDEEYDDEKVITVYPNEFDIDITHPIYEFCMLALPSKRIHPEGECNTDMMEAMNDYLLVEEYEDTTSTDDKENEEDNTDPRWSALNKLKENK